MAILEKKTCTIHYRKFQRPAGIQVSLEQAIRSALQTTINGVQVKNRYKLRSFDQADESYFINFIEDRPQSNFIFGDLLHFTKGHMQALFDETDDNAAVVSVEQMGPPQAKQFVHSQMFWMVVGDHVFVIQSQSLKSPDLEEYLRWLLVDHTNVFPLGTPIALAFAFDVSATGGDLSNIKKVSIGGVVPMTDTVPSPDSAREISRISTGGMQEETATVRNLVVSHLKKVLQVLFEDDLTRVDRVLAGLPADVGLKVDVSIGFETKKRQPSRQVLHDITVGLRNLPEGDLTIETKDGVISPDGKLRLNNKRRIRMIKQSIDGLEIVGSLLDPSDVLEKMNLTYHEFKVSGKIQ